MMNLRDQGRALEAPAADLRNPKEPGWYLARPWPISCSDDPPVVVRICPDPSGVTTVWRIGSRDPQTLDQWHLVGKIKVNGSVADLDLKKAHADGVREGLADAHAQQVEYEARRDRENPEYVAGIRLDLHEQGKGVVAIRIPVDHAEGLTNSLSDFLCWARGYNAALPRDDSDRAPMGVEAIRDINIALKTALERAEKGRNSSDGK